MRRTLLTACAATLVVATAAAASAPRPTVKVQLPSQWAHGGRGTIVLTGVAPPKAPYTSSLILYASRLSCLPSGWRFLGRKDASLIGYVLGAGVAGRFTYRDPNVAPPPSYDRHVCAYLMTISHATLARATLTLP